MTLTDLIDLEARVAADRDTPDEVLRARDHGLVPPGAADPSDRAALLAAWLDALRARSRGASVGQRLVRGYRLTGLLLVALGAGSGWGTARLLLAYDGSTPVNVMTWLLVMVGAQAALLALLGLSLAASGAWARVAATAPVLGDLRWLVGRIAEALARGGRRLAVAADEDRADAWRAALHRLGSRASLYGPVERWTLLGLTQLFGVAFNLAALGAALQLVATSDLAFAWSTTLDLDAAAFHRLVGVVAAPFAWLAPSAVPSLEVVEATRWSRLASAYVGAAPGSRAVDAALVGAWWPFVVASVAAWGLAPRAATLALAGALRRRALRRVPLDTADVDRVVRRLVAPLVRTRADAPEAPGPAADEAPPGGALRAPATPGEACAALRWRDVPADPAALDALARELLGWRVAASLAAGGLDADADGEAFRAAAAAGGPVMLVAEAWEAPDKAVFRALRALRAEVGPRRPVVVALAERGEGGGWRAPDPEDVRTWRERLATLRDPWLGVEAWT